MVRHIEMHQLVDDHVDSDLWLQLEQLGEG